MPKFVQLKLLKIKYNGDSVGRDIRVEIKIAGESFQIDKRIAAGEIKEINQEIGNIETNEKLFQSDIVITVIEKDLLFRDAGSVKSDVRIDTTFPKPRVFTFEAEVRESRSLFGWLFWGGRKAIFEIEIEARITDSFVKQYTYKGVKGDEDYNRYDSVIKEVVDYWNGEFLKDTEPPKELMDPNLVKAVIYQESRVGYEAGGEIDAMQVGNPDDPALRTLKGELKEYWIHNGKRILLEYDAKVESVEDGVYWGVRWLYHKAQGITDDNKRYWRTWKEAVRRYGPGDKSYTESVWRIYKNGVKKEKNNVIHLWEIILLLILTACLVLEQKELGKLKTAILNSFDAETATAIQDIEIKRYMSDSSLFAAVIERKKDWWENLKVGRWESGKIIWFAINDLPREQSILSHRFVNLNGFNDPILEVYGQTHMGNGDVRIYKVKDGGLSLIFNAKAADIYYDSIWSSENYQKYGYGVCGETYEGGKLNAIYEDINSDGISDVILSGQINVVCEKETAGGSIFIDNFYENAKIRVSKMPVRQEFVLTN